MKKKRMKSYLNRALALNLAVMLGMTAAGCGKEAIWENMGKQDVSAEYAESVQDMEAMAATGRYVEQFADLPENSGGPGQAMALLEEGKLAYFDGHTSCYSAEVEALFAEDADWKMIQDFPELKETYIGHSAIAKDGSLALICEEFTEEDIKVTLYVTDSVQNEYKIDGKFTDGDYIGRLFWKEPGELYGVSVRGRVCQINLQEQKMEQLFLGSGSPETLAFSENMLFALENEGIEIFDLSTKEKVESDSVLDEFCKEQFKGMLGASSGSVGAILMPQKDDILYLACESGLYRHVLGGAAIEEVMDGQMSVLGDPMTGLCNMEALADGTFVLLYTGGKMVRIVYDPDASAFPEQQLNVYSLYENDRIRQAIQLYGQKNPQVYVNYEIGIPDESGVTLEDAQKNLNM